MLFECIRKLQFISNYEKDACSHCQEGSQYQKFTSVFAPKSLLVDTSGTVFYLLGYGIQFSGFFNCHLHLPLQHLFNIFAHLHLQSFQLSVERLFLIRILIAIVVGLAKQIFTNCCL